jgi:hypothetical protein
MVSTKPTRPEMRPKTGMRVAVLTLRAQPGAVGERRLETVEVGPYDIHALADGQSGQMLPNALAHDAGLAVIHGETLLVKNRGGVD